MKLTMVNVLTRFDDQLSSNQTDISWGSFMLKFNIQTEKLVNWLSYIFHESLSLT